MKRWKLIGSRVEAAVVWFVVAMACLVFVIGSAANVPFGSKPVSFAAVLRALEWNHAVAAVRTSSFAALLVGIASLTACRFARVAPLRLVIALAAFALVLLVALDDDCLTGLLLVPLAPLCTVRMLAGRLDGEFYVEGIPGLVAVGWLLIALLFVASRSLFLRRSLSNEDRAQTI